MTENELSSFLSWAASQDRWLSLSYQLGEDIALRLKPLTIDGDMLFAASNQGNLAIKLAEITAIEGIPIADLSLAEAKRPRPHPASVKAQNPLYQEAEQFVRELTAGLINADDFR